MQGTESSALFGACAVSLILPENSELSFTREKRTSCSVGIVPHLSGLGVSSHCPQYRRTKGYRNKILGEVLPGASSVVDRAANARRLAGEVGGIRLCLIST